MKIPISASEIYEEQIRDLLTILTELNPMVAI